MILYQGGVLDVSSASRILLRDWSTGKFPRFTMPSSVSTSMSVDSPFADLYVSDEKILELLPTRKERRMTTGAVKLTPSKSETRKVTFEAPWVADDEESEDEDAEGEDDDDEEDQDVEMDNDDDGDDEEEDEEDEEEEEPVPPPSSKRKRAPPTPVHAPSKKVAFAPEPKTTKAFRSAAGARAAPAAVAKKLSTTSTKPAKKASAATPKPSVKAAMQKVANAKKSGSSTANKSAGNDEAYDFKKFF